MDQNRIKEVMSDEAFVKELSQLESVEEIQVVFKEKGLDFSIEELNKISDQFASDKELSFDQLDEVAGGGSAASVIVMYGIAIVGALKKLTGGYTS